MADRNVEKALLTEHVRMTVPAMLLGLAERIADSLLPYMAEQRATALQEAADDFEAEQRRAAAELGELRTWVAACKYLRAQADQIITKEVPRG